MTARRMIIWRHGRTEWNATGRFQGQADVPLDDLGRQQAERAAAVLAGVAPARIVSSDLSRAYQTAEALGRRVGVEVETDPRLREIDVGSWEGLTADEVMAVDPDLARLFFLREDFRRSASGETTAELSARVVEALAEFGAAGAGEEVVVVVTHGIAARVGACRLVGFPAEAWPLFGGLHNCGWIRVDWHRGEYWRLEEYNVIARTEP